MHLIQMVNAKRGDCYFHQIQRYIENNTHSHSHIEPSQNTNTSNRMSLQKTSLQNKAQFTIAYRSHVFVFHSLSPLSSYWYFFRFIKPDPLSCLIQIVVYEDV